LTSTSYVIATDRHYLWRHSITKYVSMTLHASQLSYAMGLYRKHRSATKRRTR